MYLLQLFRLLFGLCVHILLDHLEAIQVLIVKEEEKIMDFHQHHDILTNVLREKKKWLLNINNNKNDEKNNPDHSQRPSSISPIANKTLSKFLYNKSTLPKTWQNRIKDAECKYIVAGIYF